MSTVPDGETETSLRPVRILDVSRLLSRLQRNTPTGIDRVEFAYARHYAEAARARFLMTTPVSTGLLSPGLARHIVRTAVERWAEPVGQPDAERSFRQLIEILRSPIQPALTHPMLRIVEPLSGLLEWAATAIITTSYFQALGNSLLDPRLNAVRRTPSWYLHVSHINLHNASRLRWFLTTGARALFMVHDLIPISHPEYFEPDEEHRHRLRIETMARLGSAIIFNSKATKAAWDEYMKTNRLPQPPGEVVPLGVDEVFCRRLPPDRDEATTPYFVVMGTIEARKNLSFLLHVWREWSRKDALPRARLVIVGRRGGEEESALDLLDRSLALAPTVVEVSELADSRVATLLRGARALLAPSLIEGFGLPIAEALALGVPVIASDISAHREAGGTSAEYLDPLDGPAWIAALDDYAQNTSRRRETAMARIKGSRPLSWGDHIKAVEDILRDRS